VTGILGAGGMGEVYRARDKRLNRDVALKVLPDLFASDPERLARFQREAQVLASLNHPHIGQIYGLEESGTVRALIMELVEGETLADLIARGPVPADQVLPIAGQIAQALEAAHDAGIIHRDLKPANVKVRTDGTVKVLDFGLAKAFDPAASVPAAAVQNSPTVTSPMMTGRGVILGTAAYMAPEQARGRAVDKRADIWAFGVVLCEMLTGERAFKGDDPSDVLAAVLRQEIDWTRLPGSTPASIRRLLRRCIERDPKNRLRDIGEARIAIEEAMAHPDAQSAPTRGAQEYLPPSGWRVLAPWALTGVLAVALLLALVRLATWQAAPQPKLPAKLSVEVGADATLNVSGGAAAAILSPDASLLAFVAQKAAGESELIYIRRFDQLEATPLPATAGARNPFFSPDGQWIGFFAGGKLKKVATSGGAAVTLCDVSAERGGSWADDGTLFVALDSRAGLSRVPSSGGSPVALTTLDASAGEITHRWPQALPGGKAVLFTANRTVGSGDFENATVVVQSLTDGRRKVVQRDAYFGRYVPSGHVVYVHEGTLFGIPFDLEQLEPTGSPVPVLEGVSTAPSNGSAHFAVSAAGTFAFVRGLIQRSIVPIQFVDRAGNSQLLRAAPAAYNNPQFSPDGTRLAVDIRTSGQRDIWVYEWERDRMLRLTFDLTATGPVWTPDGRRIAFASARADKSTPNLYWQMANGTGEAQRLTESQNNQYPMSWHPSGKLLAYEEDSAKTQRDIMILPLDGDESSGWKPGKPTVFLGTPSVERQAAFSPDGRWLAYVSLESGQPEVYVRPFPGPGGKWQISSGIGAQPVWSENGKELFYRGNLALMVVPYAAEDGSFRAEKPRPWSPGRIQPREPDSRQVDLHPDGQRFVILKAPDEAVAKQNHVVLILNFADELRRIAPAGKR
jgi:Tol biopolymer transport system component